MEKLKRSIFFWTLTVLFLITTPIIVLNAKGYRFDIKRGVFVYSGAITFKSNPQAVNISLNDTLIESRKLNRINGSYNITGLIPAEYNMKVSAENFQTWNKKIDVHSGLANEFWNVLLVRNNYERFDSKTIGIKKFFTSPKNTFIAYTTESTEGTILKNLDVTNNKIEDKNYIFPGWQLLDSSKKENIEWSPNENFISVPVQKNIDLSEDKNNLKKEIQKSQSKIEYAYFIINLENKTSFNLNEFLKKDAIRNVRWDPQEKGRLFFLSNDILYKADILNSENLVEVSTDVSSFDLSGSYIYYSNIKNNLIFKNNLKTDESFQITSTFPEKENVLISKMIIYDDSRAIFITENKNIYIYNYGGRNNYFRKIGENIESASFSDYGKKLLFWSNNEISVYFVRDEFSQPLRNEDEIQNINRFGDRIDNVHWFSDYEHVIFSTGKYIKITEIDSRDRTNSMDITSTKIEDAMVVYNNSLEKLYFTDSNNENTTSLYSITFPEKDSFLETMGIGN